MQVISRGKNAYSLKKLDIGFIRVDVDRYSIITEWIAHEMDVTTGFILRRAY